MTFDPALSAMMAELHELFGFVSLEEAEAHYQKSLF